MKYKVGDKAIVREWDDMAKEFSVDGDGAIKNGFVRSMRKYCGKTVTIIGAEIGHYYVDDDYWIFTDEMLKPVPSSTVTITFTGDTTTATDGEKTATVNGSEEAGAIEAIKKLYHRFPQKGNEYFIVRLNRKGVDAVRHIFVDDDIDSEFRKSGNFYETEAAARAVADKINAIFKEEH